MTADPASTELAQRAWQRLGAGGWAPSSVMFPGGPVVIGRRSEFRWSWMATRMHAFMVIAEFSQTGVGLPMLDGLLDTGVDYAISNKAGLPRGLQTGVAVICVAVGRGWTPAEQEWAAKPRGRRFAAMTMPVLADLADGQVLRPQRAFVGGIYQPYLRSVVDQIVQQPLNEMYGRR